MPKTDKIHTVASHMWKNTSFNFNCSMCVL